MKILYITQWFEPEPAFKGADFARALADLGNRVDVLTGFPNYPGGRLYPGYRIRPWQKEKRAGVPVTRLPLYPSHDKSSLGRIANYASFFASVLVYGLLRAGKYDAVYVYHPPITPGFAAAMFTWAYRTPLVIEIQDLWPDSVMASGMAGGRTERILNRICDFVYRRASHIICQSDGMMAALRTRGVPQAKMTRLYNWSTYRPAGADPVPVPPPIAQSMAGHINIVYGGNIGQAQHLETLVVAAIAAHAKDGRIRLHLIGGGVERQRIADLTKRTAGPVVVMHDPVPRDVMDRVFDQADILTLHLQDDPLYDITIPSKMQHYLSCGKPIVAGLSGESAQLLKRSGAAAICRPGDVAALADAFVDYADQSAGQREVIGAKGRAFYERELAFDRALALTNAVIHRAILPGENGST